MQKGDIFDELTETTPDRRNAGAPDPAPKIRPLDFVLKPLLAETSVAYD